MNKRDYSEADLGLLQHLRLRSLWQYFQIWAVSHCHKELHLRCYNSLRSASPIRAKWDYAWGHRTIFNDEERADTETSVTDDSKSDK